MFPYRYLFFVGLLALVSACGQQSRYSTADLQSNQLWSVSFDSPTDFETGDHPDSQAQLSIEDGRYWIRQGGERSAYIWGQGGDDLLNVQVEAEAQPQSDYPNDLYGVMCRLDDVGAGYAFLISSDGFGAIARTDGRTLVFLAEWRQSDAIKRGTNVNTIRAVCLDDYLALYVNDTWVADVEDSTYPQAGQVGLLAGLLVEAGHDAEPIVIGIDNLAVSEVAFR